MNKKLFGRLLNWKFEQALQYLDNEPEEVKDLVKSLARMFGNSGWFFGDMSEIVRHALFDIGVEEK